MSETIVLPLSECRRILSEDDGLARLRLLQSQGRLRAAPKSESTGPGPIDILEWSPKLQDGVLIFERPFASRCKAKQLPAKHPGVYRICLLGESMAAGFPLAPSYTPAFVLEGLLRAGLPESCSFSIEVVDLAVPNIGPSEQLWLSEAAQQLEPDLMLFMTGNNWYYGLAVEPTASPMLGALHAQCLEAQGPQALARNFRQRLQERARVMTSTLLEQAKGCGAEAMLVVPAANHEWTQRAPLPWLGNGCTELWHQHFAQAQAALEQQSWSRALQEAAALEALDQELTGAHWRIRSEVHRALGNRAQERECAGRSVEASNWHNYSWSLPINPDYQAREMICEAERQGCAVLNLDNVLSEQLRAETLSGALFFDQCHLTADGIQLAMSSVAQMILAQLPEPIIIERRLETSAPMPIIAASAAFQAAHWVSQFLPTLCQNDVREQVEGLLRDAVQDSEQILPVLRAYVRSRGQSCPPELSGHFSKASRFPGSAAALKSRHLNPILLQAVLQVLEHHDALGSALDDLLSSQMVCLKHGLELSGACFEEWFWARSPVGWMDPLVRHNAPHHQSYWPQSRFAFVASAEQELQLTIVARGRAATQSLELIVNGDLLLSTELQLGWSRYVQPLPISALVNGINQLELRWSFPVCDEEAAIQCAKERFEIGAEAELFPVFGEIYSLRVLLAD